MSEFLTKDQRLEQVNKEQRMLSSVFFVEANSNERLTLWNKYKDETAWEEDNMGFSQVIGYVKDDKELPVNVEFFFAKIHGERICFFNTVSRYNDTQLVRQWLIGNYPTFHDGGTRESITDANNFHLAVNYCKEL